MVRKVLIKHGCVVTNNRKNEIKKLDVFVEGNRIKEVKKDLNIEDAKVINAENRVIIPGFIQTHVHLTQTLFKNRADNLELLEWLTRRVWPFEAMHTENSNYISSKLGLAELIRSGTTTILDMGTVRHHNSVFEAVNESGIRAVSGKCMMDCGKNVPKELLESTEDSINESIGLLKKWHNRGDGRIKYAFAPRFVISCSEELFLKVKELSQEHGVMIHTHASENRSEVELIVREKGMGNIKYLNKLNITGANLVLAHCIWLDEEELDILSVTGTKVSHCPSSNLKLASGIAKIPEMLRHGINVSLGADGAPCNNNLNIFREMRTASLIQKTRLSSPTVMSAETVFRMATLEGAKALNLEDEIGSIEAGKKADIVILNLNKTASYPYNQEDVISAIVYSADSLNVETVMADGKILMQKGKLLTINEDSVIKDSERAVLDITKNIS